MESSSIWCDAAKRNRIFKTLSSCFGLEKVSFLIDQLLARLDRTRRMNWQKDFGFSSCVSIFLIKHKFGLVWCLGKKGFDGEDYLGDGWSCLFSVWSSSSTLLNASRSFSWRGDQNMLLNQDSYISEVSQPIKIYWTRSMNDKVCVTNAF